MPLPRLSVRPTDFCSVPFNQCAHGCMAVHGLEHLETGSVYPHDGEIVVKRRKPPFVGTMLIGDQVGDVPGQEIQGLSREVAGFVNSNSRLHSIRGALRAEAYTSVQFFCNKLWRWRGYRCEGTGVESVTIIVPCMIGWIRHRY